LTSRVDRAATRSGTGSLSAAPPAARVAARWPPKVSSCSVPGAARAPEARTATDACPTFMASVPNAFVSRIRTRAPPALRNTTLRTVWSVRPAPAGHVEPGTSEPTTWLAPQAVTQFPAPPAAPDELCAPDAACAVIVAALSTIYTSRFYY